MQFCKLRKISKVKQSFPPSPSQIIQIRAESLADKKEIVVFDEFHKNTISLKHPEFATITWTPYDGCTLKGFENVLFTLWKAELPRV